MARVYGQMPGWVWAVFAVAVGATFALQVLFDRTAIGRSFRAVSDDKDIAELMGLDARKVYALTLDDGL